MTPAGLVVAAREAIRLVAQLDARHVAQMQDRSVRIGAKNDIAEFLGLDQAPLGANRVGELLALADIGSPPIWPAGFTLFCAWMAAITSVAVTPSLRHFVRLHPDAHRILAAESPGRAKRPLRAQADPARLMMA